MTQQFSSRLLFGLISLLLLATLGLVVRAHFHSQPDLPAEVLGVDEQASPLDSPTQIPAISAVSTTGQVAQVTRVIDGDTIIINGNTKVRYIGVDTPETVDPHRPVGCFGKEASNFNKQLVEGKTIRLVKDVSETDKFGRLLRYVYLQTDKGEVFVNDALARQGYAMVKTYPPDVAFQAQFLQAQQEARQNNRGLWSKC